MFLEVLVDGQAYAYRMGMCTAPSVGALDLDRATTRLVAQCQPPSSGDPQPGLAPGTHEAIVRATIPGTSFSWESDPVTFSLDCPSSNAGCAQAPGGAPRAPWTLPLLAAALLLGMRRARRRAES